MNKFEKKVFIAALIFVIVYLGAIILSINSKTDRKDITTKIESVQIKPEERTFVLAELLLPVAIIFIMAICFILIKKKNARTIIMSDEEEDEDIDWELEQDEEEDEEK